MSLTDYKMTSLKDKLFKKPEKKAAPKAEVKRVVKKKK